MVKAEDVLTKDQTFFKTKDGTIARKGTIAAAILNASFIEDLMDQPQSSARDEKLKSLIQDIHSLLPGIHALNLFQFFTPIEWIQSKKKIKEGRILIAVLYLQRHPECVDNEVLNALQEIQPNTHLELKVEIEKLLSDHAVSCRGNNRNS